MLSRTKVVLMTLFSVAIASRLFGQRAEIPVTNWTVPPYRETGSSGGLSTMTDVSPGIAFVAMAPCRIVDTRNAAGPYGGPALASNVARNFDVDNGPCTGIPLGTDAYSLSFGAILPPADGFLTAWPTGTAQPTISQLNFLAGEVVANAAVVPAGTGGSITVLVNIGPTNVYIDINGYFTDSYNAGNRLVASGSVGGDGMILGTNAAGSSGSAGVKGVQGAAVASAPEQAPAGLVGTSSLFDGVLGITITGSGGAGVKGIRTSGSNPAIIVSSGELGGANLGGQFVNDVEIDGDIAVGSGLGPFGPGNGDFGGSVTVDGNLNVLGGTKNFVEPHATDASKVIRYVSLEGPESGTYFRGRGRFQNGIARIAVPEDFRTVTADEGLTVQITPIGGMATVGVLRMDLNEIVAQSSRNLEFSYLVQGVRRAHADFNPIGDAGTMYVRRGAASRLRDTFPPDIKRRLIENGTFNSDGTVNMDTARRLGWDRIWTERETERPVSETRPD